MKEQSSFTSMASIFHLVYGFVVYLSSSCIISFGVVLGYAVESVVSNAEQSGQDETVNQSHAFKVTLASMPLYVGGICTIK